eukprot:TRINITY_DN1938_c0_g1_i2.p1 TRINITY_DN1938_c0_g1~~TRINITY_DN1938_c0_g1_i2.p1  ORF type:complete len:173 (+),score=15.84 TRINITY_DN1938_c0_g1_i2:495-1013(+)
MWFGTRTESSQELKPRIVPLLDIISKKHPHIVCLQEVTVPILRLIEAQDWIRKEYIIVTCPSVQGSSGYGLAILTRLKTSAIFVSRFPTRLGRSLLGLKFKLNGQVVFVATNHLESYAKDRPTREQQLEVAKETLTSGSDQAFLMGDFNWASEAERSESVEKLGFLDNGIQC